jgi:hypothetical protein
MYSLLKHLHFLTLQIQVENTRAFTSHNMNLKGSSNPQVDRWNGMSDIF